MTRGGGAPSTDTLMPVMGQQGGGYDVLGAILQSNPAFQQLLNKRAALAKPVLHNTPLQKARDWDIPLGPVSGAAGTSTVITIAPQCYFRGEKLMAQDSASPVGSGTRITQILIGQRLQRTATGGGTLTAFYANNSLGNGIRWDTCQPAYTIAMTISFVSACTFDAVVFGKAVV